jgi:hypothetical protein
MNTLPEAAAEFLSSDGIAIVGVSRDERNAANAIYRKLRSSGARVVPVNGRAEEVEGDPCYPDLRSIPSEVRAVLLVVPKGAALDLVCQCQELGIHRVWIHGTFGFGSVSAEAVAFCRQHGLRVIVSRWTLGTGVCGPPWTGLDACHGVVELKPVTAPQEFRMNLPARRQGGVSLDRLHTHRMLKSHETLGLVVATAPLSLTKEVPT